MVGATLEQGKTLWGVTAWVHHVSEGELSLLSGIVRQLQSLVEDDDASLGQISQAILNDPGLTSRVLGIANSVTYNPSGQTISTVSRATILLGLNVIRNLFLTVRIIDDLMGHSSHERLPQLLRRSFRTAVQARRFWGHGHSLEQEEAFVVALLRHLGEAVFWSVGGEVCDAVQARLHTGEQLDSAAQQVIGTSFRELSLALAKTWRLSDGIQQGMKPPVGAVPAMVKTVGLCEELVLAWERGASAEQVDQVLSRLAQECGMDMARARSVAAKGQEEAARLAEAFGLPAETMAPKKAPAVAEAQAAVAPTAIEPDTALQLSILREMCVLLGERADINTLLRMLLEGLHRGVGLRRVLLAFVAPDGSGLRGRSAIGDLAAALSAQFEFRLEASPALRAVLSNHRAVWLGEGGQGSWPPVNLPLLHKVESRQAFAGTLRAGNRAIALIYADMAESGIALTPAAFEGFQHFIQQANLCLGALRPGGG